MEGLVSVFKYKGGRCYRDLYADENAAAFKNDCSVAGIVGFVTGVVGSLQVSEAMKIIVENENILSGVVLSVDLEQQVLENLKYAHEVSNGWVALRSLVYCPYFRLLSGGKGIVGIPRTTDSKYHLATCRVVQHFI